MSSDDLPRPLLSRRQRFWLGMLAIAAFFALLVATLAIPRYQIGIPEVLGTLGLAGGMLGFDLAKRTGL